MSVCSVCNKKVPNIAMKIVRSPSGYWACKDCLKKAKISRMEFGSKKMTAVDVRARIYTANPGDPSVELKCPACNNDDLQIISDVHGKGVSATKIAFFGALGLGGAGKVTTTHYWICKKCGYKFKA